MKQPTFCALTHISRISFALALVTAANAGFDARADDGQGASSHNMRLIGTNDLQARSTYQPTVHKYARNRYILFTGHHTLATAGEGQLHRRKQSAPPAIPVPYPGPQRTRRWGADGACL
jgi:hypothetical protein